MRISLDNENRFLTSDGSKVDLKEAFRYSGIKAAWCYKKGTATPEIIREMSEEDLIRIGINTWVDDHGTPDEHYQVSVEITNIPKLLCMILNSEHQYTADERSLRYTKVLENPAISPLEIELYNKWYQIFVNIFETQYGEWFYQINQKDEKKAKADMRKKAQENARYFISVFTPTSIAYTAPWYQWQKIAAFLQDLISNPNTPLKKAMVPYAQDMITQLIDLRVVVETKEAASLYPDLEKILEEKKDHRELLYRNNKETKFYLFADNNPFSGIDKPNSFESSINYNSRLSIAGFADVLRHRTSYLSMKEPTLFSFITPPFIRGTIYEKGYMTDMQRVNGIYPQGQIIDFNVDSSIYRIVQFMGKERACERPQQEVENWFVNEFVSDIVNALKDKPAYRKEYELLKKGYLNRCRCAYPDYHCPNPCGHPRTKRPF